MTIDPFVASTSFTQELWQRLRRPFLPVDAVSVLLGVAEPEVEQLLGTKLATGTEAETLLEVAPAVLRQLRTSTKTELMRCRGELRGPIRWGETLAARSSSGGAGDVFVCASSVRDFNVSENRILVAALEAVRLAGLAAEPIASAPYDDAAQQRARENGRTARQLLERRVLADTPRVAPRPRDLLRTRSSRSRELYDPALDVLDRVRNPVTVADLLRFCDRRTRAQHGLAQLVLQELEKRGIPVPDLDVDDGWLTSGPFSYRHNGRGALRPGPTGIVVNGTVLDVPARLRDRDPRRAQKALERALGTTDCLAITDASQIERAVTLALSSRPPAVD